MKLEEYQKLAIKTESKIDKVVVNSVVLGHALCGFQEFGVVLDSLKKYIYYNKPIDLDTFDAQDVEGHAWSVDYFFENNNEIEVKTDPRVLHSILGILTEAGELAEALICHLQTGDELDLVNIQEELMDINWYQAIFHDATGMSWSNGLNNNIDKLKARYGEKFSEDKAINRDLELEREILERQDLLSGEEE